ncbi:MAG: hypothetical protein K0S18_139 [Anaerocolumna sp.]|jgi:hypothetical protein|nr:hypothetical protein [Anaerocolumna sp.]
MKYGDIVKYKGQLGELVTDDKKNFLFHPVKFGNYYYNQLDIVTENDIEVANFDEHISYIEQEFVWGEVIKTHCIGEYQIMEFKPEHKEDAISYHGYINFEDTNTTHCSIESALISLIARNKLEVNEARYAELFINKMLNGNL